MSGTPNMKPLLQKSNEIIKVLQNQKPLGLIDCITVIGLVAGNVTEFYVAKGMNRQVVIDEFCKCIRIMCK